jgi:glycosyltransferase involved in cell wall biosynthesis
MNDHRRLLTVIVLTRDEALHLPRLFASLIGMECRLVVVDSGSTDGTQELAKKLGAEVLSHPFENQATQFNWALDHLSIDTPWVMRMDADEYLLPGLTDELSKKLPGAPQEVSGWMVRRRVYFWGRWIRHGGYYPTWLLRVWRTGAGRLEARSMDEHVVLASGKAARLKHDIADENLKGLTFWTDKHNHYADREVLDILETGPGSIGESLPDGQAGQRRKLKFSVYGHAPLYLRAVSYWAYRYFLRLGILDGMPGLVFHFLQGFWYRFLIDAKIQERRLLATGRWAQNMDRREARLNSRDTPESR